MPKNIHVAMGKMNRVRRMMIMIRLIGVAFEQPSLLLRRMPLSVLLRIDLASLVVP
jgi:hypothetical protein